MKDAAKSVSSTRNASDPKERFASMFYQTYVPAKITQPSAITELTPLMNEVSDRYRVAVKSNAPYLQRMTRWIYTGFKPVAEGNYHAAARINAIMMLSRLVKSVDATNSAPPTPLQVVSVLLPIYQDDKNPDGVRAAALYGLRSFCANAPADVPGSARQPLIDSMNALLQDVAPQGRDSAAHAFLQRYAVDILTSLRTQANPALGQQLVSISTETNNHDLIALYSAAKIGSMSADLKDNVKSTDDILDSWTVRAMRSFQYEIIRLKAMTRPLPSGGDGPTPESRLQPKETQTKSTGSAGEMEEGYLDTQQDDIEAMMQSTDDEYGDMEMGMMSMGMGFTAPKIPQDPDVFLSRRKLNFVLQQLHRGVTGSSVAGVPETPGGLLSAAPGDKEKIEAWVESMNEVLTGLNDTSVTKRDKFVKALEAQVALLREIAGPAAEKAEEEANPVVVPGVPMVASNPTPAVTDDEEVSAEGPEAGAAPVLDKAGVPQFPVGVDELGFE